MVLNLREYRFRGAAAEGQGRTLDDAIHNLAEFWDSRPSLVVHNWGVLRLAITVGGTEAVFEVSDPAILDDLEGGDTRAFVDWLAERMGVDPEDAVDLLDRSSHVVAAVDRIRPPGEQAGWEPDPGMGAEDVLPDATLEWVGDIERQLDIELKRGKGRPRTRQARRLLEAVVKRSMERGLTNRQISKDTGLPVSTVRDTRMRVERQDVVREEFFARRPGQRLTEEQRELVLDTLDASKGNAAEAARQLGIPARTIRGLRQRELEASAARQPKGRSSYSEADKQAVLERVRAGLSATEAGRELGIPGRTARGWVAKSKEK